MLFFVLNGIGLLIALWLLGLPTGLLRRESRSLVQRLRLWTPARYAAADVAEKPPNGVSTANDSAVRTAQWSVNGRSYDGPVVVPFGAVKAFYDPSAQFGLDEPLWKQYLNFWLGLLHGDLGPSIAYVGSSVSDLIRQAIPYTLALLVPAIVLSYITGNRVGAMAARRKSLDNTVLPLSYVLSATPYMWLALVLAYVLSFHWGVFPVSGAYDFSLQPAWTWEFASSFLQHWFLPGRWSSHEASSPTGSSRSSRSSSSRSGAGRSGCGT